MVSQFNLALTSSILDAPTTLGLDAAVAKEVTLLNAAGSIINIKMEGLSKVVRTTNIKAIELLCTWIYLVSLRMNITSL